MRAPKAKTDILGAHALTPKMSTEKESPSARGADREPTDLLEEPRETRCFVGAAVSFDGQIRATIFQQNRT